jgi:hypothetical protein
VEFGSHRVVAAGMRGRVAPTDNVGG